ncbi:hypothetical protein [Spirosoma rhododendri]|uniref:Uncharacterized protein n=1 Tax=Spirosoma rhododendri TaxID=2728024 RepID=A0A7L5DJ36_9BACT|nr:hypothetical protein [Spirosoma rhododendri]QJD78419.1 hypothetical protein HH216_08285 [Spirosoma rhododendri]
MHRRSPDDILHKIARLQQPDGLFPSIRRNGGLAYERVDTNVFFTAVTVFTLQQLKPMLPPDSCGVVDKIAQQAVGAYPLFRNKDGLDTYNFWPTSPSRHFPNGHLFGRFDHFRIPDDIDDTAMVYLTTQPTPETLTWFKDKLAQHANGATIWIRNTYPEYVSLRAYSTWFGKTMPIDFDACALSNLLYCMYYYELPRNQHDTDSLAYLRNIVQSGQYLRNPFGCAPHYARPSLIAYHLSRLMAAFAIPELEPIRTQLITDARQLLERATNRLEQILLSTTLLRLGERTPLIDLNEIEADFADFHFFIAGLLTAYETPLLRRWAHHPITQMRWYCDAHCWALVLEYSVLYV